MTTTASTEAGSGHNSIDQGKTRAYVGRIERLFVNLETERGEYMQRCRTIRGQIKGVYDDAAIEGVPKRELKAVIKARGLERKADDCREELEAEERLTFDQIKAALGDFASTPLGTAALHVASPH